MVKQMSMNELVFVFEKLGEKEIILDVRGPDEFLAGHVPGSQNIPHTEVHSHLNELKKWDRIFVHCRSGGRAQIACQTLEALGLKNLICIGHSGMKDWIEAGYPIQK